MVLGARGLPSKYSFGAGLCASLGYGGALGIWSLPFCTFIPLSPVSPSLCPVPELPRHPEEDEDEDEAMKVHLDNPGYLPIPRSLVAVCKALSPVCVTKTTLGIWLLFVSCVCVEGRGQPCVSFSGPNHLLWRAGFSLPQKINGYARWGGRPLQSLSFQCWDDKAMSLFVLMWKTFTAALRQSAVMERWT